MSSSSNENFENVLQKVNSYITLKPNEREEYTKAFDAVRDHFLSKMHEEDKVFRDLNKGHSLGGSYADNLKIIKPDEFDLVVHLKIRYRNLVDIIRDPQKPGFVKINIRRVLETLSRDSNSADLYQRLQLLVDNNNYLVQNKLQSWIESIVTKVLSKHSKKIKSHKKTYYIEQWQKCGPAHTLSIRGPTFRLSIDFVPGLIFISTEPKWPASRRCPPYKNKNWVAIPKPIKGCTDDNIYFITSYPSEAYFINGKDNLKNTLRMMKKLRNRQGIENLKSYFIKTAYLLETDGEPDDFWSSNSANHIFMHMFERILTYVENKNLPFFWCRQFNQLQSLTKDQLETMYWQLKNCYDHIEQNKVSNPRAIYKIFLTEDEMVAMNRGLTFNNKTQ